jgi:sugar lactone lactonase YvrE
LSTHQLQQVADTRDRLGECQIWSAEENALYWIDVRGPRIHRKNFTTGVIDSWAMPELVGCIALRESTPGLIVALRSGVALFDPGSGSFDMLAAPHAGQPQMRFNDAKCDRQGRFWVGSMDDVGRGPVGMLYRFEAGVFTPVISGIAVPNSLSWSLDGTTMYFADGIEPVIWAYPFDTATGALGERRIFTRLPGDAGIPDGATVDSENFVWSAHYGGNVVTRYAPDGRIDRVVPVPVSQPTSCAFGGENLATLFVTTASQRLSPEQLASQPLAGALLSLEAGVFGCPEPRFRG